MPGDLDLALRIRADLGQALNRLSRLEERLRKTGASGRAAGSGARAAASGVDQFDRAARRAARSARRLDVAVGAFGANIASGIFARALRGIEDFAQGVVEAGIRLQGFEGRFRFATSSIQESAEEMQFARQEAERLGLGFRTVAQGYSSILAAARGTVITVADTREIFLGIAEASRVLSLSSADTLGALTAVEQIISKGKVSAEELRQQLGERLPGAVQTMARALGISIEELDKRLEQGSIGLEGLIALARQLRTDYGGAVPEAVSRADASFARLGNAIERLQESIARTGLLDWLARVADGVRRVIDEATDRPRAGLAARQTTAQRLAAQAADELARAEARLARAEEAASRGRRGQAGRGPRRGEDLAALRAEVASFRELAQVRAQIARDQTPEWLRAEIGLLGGAGGGAQLQARLRRLRRDLRILEAQTEDERVNQDRFEIGRFQGAAARQRQARPRATDETTAQRALDRLVAQRKAHEEQIARLTLDRIAQIDRAERETLAEIAALRDAAIKAAGDNEQKLLAVKIEAEQAATAATERFAAARVKAREAEAEEAAELARRQAEAEKRAAEEAARAAEAARRRSLGAVGRGLENYAIQATDAATQIEDATVNAFRGAEDALTQFVTTGKFRFSDFANSIIADVTRIAVRTQITGPLAQALLGLVGGGGFTGPANLSPGSFSGFPVGHSGGFPSEIGRRRSGAVGLNADERFTIQRNDEALVTPGQLRAIAGMGSGFPRELRAEVVNTGGPDQRVREATATITPEALIVRVVTENIAAGGEIGRQIEGLAPGTVL